MKKYILKNKIPILCDDLHKWATWMENWKQRIVKKTKIGDVEVSTVFLGSDHAWEGGKPILFETMVFGGKYDEFQERYCTWEEAEEGHRITVDMIKEDK